MKQRERRLHDVSEEFRQRYRWRAGIEATMSRFKHQMGMARLRVRGMAKVTYAAMFARWGSTSSVWRPIERQSGKLEKLPRRSPWER